MKKIALSATLASLFMSSAIHAQQTVAPEAAPVAPAAAPAPAAPTGWDVSGYVDVSYNYLSQSNVFTSGVPSRVFDTERSGFAVRQVGLTLTNLPKEGWGGLVNVTVGKDANVINSYGLGLGQTTQFDLTQAYAQYAGGPITVIGGKFVTLAGSEVIASPSNTNFSRSILFGYAIPFTHTGFRGTYAVNDKLNLILGVNNGWDTFKETNGDKTIELGFAYTPSKVFSLAGQAYSGRERVGGLVRTGPQGTRNLIDLVGTYNATDKLSFVLNYDYGSQENAGLASGAIGRAKWTGIAGYANYQINDQWRIGGRGEYFDDKDGYRTGLAQKWKEATLTLAYLPIKALEIRAEARTDWSNVPAFVNIAGTGSQKSQHSFALQALYKF